MYDNKLSKIDNMNNFVHYVKHEVKDNEKEKFNDNIKFLLYFIGSITIINMIIKGNK